ncbi:MAG: hypothetical protein ACOYJK_00530 [Prevotella sp.]|jgi:hypothetical protein
MEIKCPKCRFRFEVPASPGMMELQCNCPRCGIPFTYIVEGESNNTTQNHASADGSYENTSGATGQETNSSHSGTTASSHKSTTEGIFPPPPPFYTREKNLSPFQTTQNTKKNRSNGKTNAVGRKGHGCLKTTLILLAALILGVTLVIRQCESTKSYSTENINIGASSNDNAKADPIIVPAPSYDANANSEKAPSWIQGNWHVETDYGGISLKIYGNQIAETSGGETSYGSYRYQNHHLYCNFGDNNIFVYRLVEETHQIDAGNGIMMEKVDR